LPLTCSGSNIVAIPEQLTNTASLIKEVSEENVSVIASTNYINKELCFKEIMMLAIAMKKLVVIEKL
jgi:hypothetical protein